MKFPDRIRIENGPDTRYSFAAQVVDVDTGEVVTNAAELTLTFTARRCRAEVKYVVPEPSEYRGFKTVSIEYDAPDLALSYERAQ